MLKKGDRVDSRGCAISRTEISGNYLLCDSLTVWGVNKDLSPYAVARVGAKEQPDAAHQDAHGMHMC